MQSFSDTRLSLINGFYEMSLLYYCNLDSNPIPLINDTQVANNSMYLFLLYSHYYHPYLIILISGAGVISNFLLFLVLIRPTMLKHGGHGSVHAILGAIAAADFATNSTNLAHVIATLMSREDSQNQCPATFLYTYHWNAFLLVHADASVYLHTVSLYLTIVLAALRCSMLQEQNVTSTALRGIAVGVWSTLATASVVMLSCVPNILRNTIVEIGLLPEQQDGCYDNNEVVSNGSSKEGEKHYSVGVPYWWNCPLEQVSFWTYALICKIIPCLMLTYFIRGLLKVIIGASRRRQRLLSTSSMVSRDGNSPSDHTSALLISIVFIFWLTELPQGILLILSVIDPGSFYSVYQHTGDVLDLLSLINSNVNFALYCAMSSKFRQEFVDTFKCCCCCCYGLLKPIALTTEFQQQQPVFRNSTGSLRLAAERATKRRGQQKDDYFSLDTSVSNGIYNSERSTTPFLERD